MVPTYVSYVMYDILVLSNVDQSVVKFVQINQIIRANLVFYWRQYQQLIFEFTRHTVDPLEGAYVIAHCSSAVNA